MNIKPIYGINTQVIFTPDAYIRTQEIMAFAVENECWVQIRGSGSQSSIRVAGPLEKVEQVHAKYKQFEMNCFDGRCDARFCQPSECNYLADIPVEVPMINHSGMPL